MGTRNGRQLHPGDLGTVLGRSLPEWDGGRGRGQRLGGGTGNPCGSLLLREQLWRLQRGLWEGVPTPRVTLARDLSLSGLRFPSLPTDKAETGCCLGPKQPRRCVSLTSPAQSEPTGGGRRGT